ncbi:MAG: hypothetical protein Q8L39_04650 [Burkholderiales bacterium]|nr:hypothetical protein [Burkholderiales bacterium]
MQRENTAFPITAQSRSMRAIIIDRLTCAQRAVIALELDGYSVIDVRLTGCCRPTIEIQNDARLGQLVDDARACYYARKHGLHGVERVGQFELEGCRVIWTVKGH